MKKDCKPRFEGYRYGLSPWRLVWNGDFYYIVGWYAKYEKIMSYRVDRIVSAPTILEDDAIPMPKSFDLDKYLNTMFHMFSSERQTVDLICDSKVVDAIIDSFGEKVAIKAVDDERFKVSEEVAVNNVLFAWIVGFGGLVKIVTPEDVREEYKVFVAKAHKDSNKISRVQQR